MEQTFNKYRIENAGGTETLTTPDIPSAIYLFSTSGVVLAANYVMDYDTLPNVGANFKVYFFLPSLDLNGFTITIFNKVLTTEMVAAEGGWLEFQVIESNDPPALISNYAPSNFADTEVLLGTILVDGTTPLDKLESGTSAQIIVANGSGVPAYVTMSGDITTSNAGVTAIGAGVIVDADVNASAAITRSKIAAGTAAHVVINAAGTGLFSSEAQLALSRGGLAIDASASVGFAEFDSGVTIGALTDITRRENISFVTAAQGTYYIYFPFACTVTQANVRVTSVVSGSDVGELLFENDASVAMTGDNLTAGVLEVASGAAFGTGYTTSLDTNNSFSAGESMRITSSKTTTGGVVSVDVTYTRTGLV